MIVLSRISELNSKYHFREEVIKTTFYTVNLKRKEQSLPWKIFNLDSINQNIRETYIKLPQLWSKASAAFTLISSVNFDDYPDFIGYSYNNIGEMLIEAIEENDFKLFEAGYNSYFGISMLYQETIREDMVKQGLETQIEARLRVLANPILEFCTISGMAILWGEINNDSRWINSVNKTLTDLKMPDERCKQTFESWIKIIQTTEHIFPAIYNRDLIHTNWEQRLIRAICSIENFEYEDIGWGNRKIKTDNSFIKAYLRGNDLSLGFLGEKIYDIYLIRCINPLIDSTARYKSRSKWEERINTNE